MSIVSPVIVQLKIADPTDAAAIASMAEKIWRVHYTPIIGADQVTYMLSNMHSAEKVAQQMKDGQRFSFIVREGINIGYTSWSTPQPGELFIHKFYIEPSLQGNGIGKQVFAELLQLNPEANTIRLTVNRKNYKSINFYFRLGFVIDEVKDFDIGGGYFMNDFVMKWKRR